MTEYNEKLNVLHKNALSIDSPQLLMVPLMIFLCYNGPKVI